MSTIQDDYETPDSDQSDADKRLYVRFSLQPRLDSKRTEEEGRECYREVEFVTILIPGDKTLSVNRPIMPSDKHRFPKQYQNFLNKKGEVLIGTPLSMWPLVSETQRRELEYFNVRTVEQLADVADGVASNMMGMLGLKQKAQKFITATKETAPLIKMQQELSQRDDSIAALQDQLTKLAARFEKTATTR